MARTCFGKWKEEGKVSSLDIWKKIPKRMKYIMETYIYTINNNSNERKMHDYQPMLSRTYKFGRIIYLELTTKMSMVYNDSWEHRHCSVLHLHSQPAYENGRKVRTTF